MARDGGGDLAHGDGGVTLQAVGGVMSARLRARARSSSASPLASERLPLMSSQRARASRTLKASSESVSQGSPGASEKAVAK